MKVWKKTPPSLGEGKDAFSVNQLPVFVSVTEVVKYMSVTPRLVEMEAFSGPAAPTQLADCLVDVDVSCTLVGTMPLSPIRPLHTYRLGAASADV